MKIQAEPTQHLIPLSSKVAAFPILHGRAVFSQALRNLLWKESFDCIALAFPEALEEEFKTAVEKLPVIHAVTIKIEGQTTAYATIDPCDAFTEATRQGLQRRCPVIFTEDNSQLVYKEHIHLPESHLISTLGLNQYYRLCAKLFVGFSEEEAMTHRAITNIPPLMKLEERFEKILFLCDFPLLAVLDRSPGDWLSKLDFLRTQPVDETLIEDLEHIDMLEIKSFPVEPNHLYFALGELPYYTGEFEKERFNALELPLDPMTLIKKIFIQTRDKHISNTEETQNISTTRLQILLTYIRNLCIQEGRLIPDLFEIITGSKGVFGPYFAAKVLEAAKYYPFFEPIPSEPLLKIGFDRIHPPDEDEPMEALNLMQDEPKYWKKVQIKKEPDRKKQNQYRYQWDPRGMCSHLPEDILIENFNQQARQRTAQTLRDALSHSEKFSTSIKDGLDMRETLRHYYKGEIYVKENPPAQRGVDTVVAVFDENHDDHYPQRTTWYAEHTSESTLTFFGTDPFKKLIGPGVAQAEYGGFSLLFPPRPIPNVFELLQGTTLNLTEQLVYGACKFSKEKNISYLAFKRPSLRLRTLAKKSGKQLIWIPLTRYSQETLRKLKRFHVLNGKKVRSWASRYIPE